MAKKDMLGTAVRKLVTLPDSHLGVVCDLLEKYSDPAWVDATKRMLRKEDPWPKGKSDLLEPLKSTIKTPAIPEFRAIDHLKINPNEDRKTAEVVIGWINNNFRVLFLQGTGKIERDVLAGSLRPHKLRKASVDGSIIAEFGGETVVESTLAEMYEALKLQGRGQKGALLTNGHANIFYIRDVEDKLWAVRCNWDSGNEYWDLSAYPVADPRRWDADDRVVVRDSES